MDSSSSSSTSITSVRIVVVGDVKTGKTSLIHAAAHPEAWAGESPPELPAVMPPTILAEDMFPDRVPATVIDTSCSDHVQTDRELQMADAVVLVYNKSSIRRLRTRWLHRLRQLRVNVPIILARCMLKLETPDDRVAFLAHEFLEIQWCMGFSPFIRNQAVKLFCVVESSILHPIRPLYDPKVHKMKPRCEWALTRIFILADTDKDGVLSDEEFTTLQETCFDCLLNINAIREYNKGYDNDAAFDEKGRLKLRGFLMFHELLLEDGDATIAWAMFRKFGYNGDEWWLPSIKRNPDQSVELTSEAVEFLRGVFSSSDRDRVYATLYSLLESLGMSEAPHSNLDDFVAQWALITLLDPVLSVENLIYLGYADDPSSLVRVTRGRSVDRKKGQSDRKVFQCFVFGAKMAGKSSLLQSFVGSPFSETYTSTTVEGCAVKIVDQPFLWQYPPLGSFLRGRLGQKALILREIPEDAVENLLFRKDALAACDVAVFVHNRGGKMVCLGTAESELGGGSKIVSTRNIVLFVYSWSAFEVQAMSMPCSGFVVHSLLCFDESSWLRAKELLVQVASHGKSTGYEVPCLIVAAKGDLEPSPTAIQDSTRVSQDLGIEAPIRISTKLGDFNDVFKRIVRAAEHPQLSIPEIEAGKTRKLYHRLLNHSLMVVSVVAALNIVGLAALHVYATTRKNTSSS